MNFPSALDNILYQGLDDWVQVVQIIYEVEAEAISRGEARSVTEIQEISIAMIAHLVRSDLMVLGDVDRSGFIEWRLGDVARHIQEVRDRWSALGRTPILGDVCWLKLTEQGELYASSLIDKQ